MRENPTGWIEALLQNLHSERADIDRVIKHIQALHRIRARRLRRFGSLTSLKKVARQSSTRTVLRQGQPHA